MNSLIYRYKNLPSYNDYQLSWFLIIGTSYSYWSTHSLYRITKFTFPPHGFWSISVSQLWAAVKTFITCDYCNYISRKNVLFHQISYIIYIKNIWLQYLLKIWLYYKELDSIFEVFELFSSCFIKSRQWWNKQDCDNLVLSSLFPELYWGSTIYKQIFKKKIIWWL